MVVELTVTTPVVFVLAVVMSAAAEDAPVIVTASFAKPVKPAEA